MPYVVKLICFFAFLSIMYSTFILTLQRVALMIHISRVKSNQSHYTPEVLRGFQEVKVPRLRDIGPEWW